MAYASYSGDGDGATKVCRRTGFIESESVLSARMSYVMADAEDETTAETERRRQSEADAGLDLPEVDVDGNRIRLFVESPGYVAALTADMRAAGKRIWIESYIVADDDVGRALADVLMARASAGVKCRLMYDAVGSIATPQEFFAELQASGVELHPYRTLWSTLWRYRFLRYFNRRNHRKLAVIDDDVAYFGGMNFADPGSSLRPSQRQQAGADAEGDEGAEQPKYWRDLHVRLQGPRQAEIAWMMQSLWMRHDKHRLRRPAPSLAAFLETGCDGVFFFDAQPTRRYHRASTIFRTMIGAARREIATAMAYFLPTGAVLRALLKARKRRVEIRVVVPGESDVAAVQWAARHMYPQLLRRGIRIYERKERMLHAKFLVIDGLDTVVGSCNIDPRSLLTNLEFIAIIRSRELGRQAAQIFEYERRHAVPVRIRDLAMLPWWKRQLHKAAFFFKRWL